jgi:hypothetical protein
MRLDKGYLTVPIGGYCCHIGWGVAAASAARPPPPVNGRVEKFDMMSFYNFRAANM